MTPRTAPLSRLLETAAPAHTPVAFGRRGERRLRDLTRDVAALTARVEEIGAGRWLLVSDDSYEAAVALLALARCRARAVLPPNRQPETLRRLSQGACGALVDAAADAGEPPLPADLPRLAPLGHAQADPRAPARLDRDAPLAEFCTSGTTGDGQVVVKALRHLEDEVVALERHLGPGLPGAARIFATASHQHIYGLLFRILWPLASGRPFQRDTFLHSQELLPRLAASERAALVTTPVHLKRMAAAQGLRALRGTCVAIYSSGGPLDAETAKSVASQLGAAPWEVFGSTETGGVAVRRRDVHGEAWEPLPGVTIRRLADDGRLEVTSAFVSAGEELPDGRARALMGDRSELLPGGGFRLLGRADRVVKVGEKRLSLPEMEQALERHAYVAEAALLVTELAGEGRVHAVVSPSAEGSAALARQDRRSFGATLAKHLSQSYDPVLLPRAWRVVAALPRDAQDKVPLAALRELFAEPAASERPRLPTLLAERRGADALERRLEVPPDLAQLEGHFDVFPIVPGVVQVGWAMSAAAEWLGRRLRIARLEALKFPTPLRPDRRVTLRLERSADGARVRFRIDDGERVFATGRAVLADAPRDEGERA